MHLQFAAVTTIGTIHAMLWIYSFDTVRIAKHQMMPLVSYLTACFLSTCLMLTFWSWLFIAARGRWFAAVAAVLMKLLLQFCDYGIGFVKLGIFSICWSGPPSIVCCCAITVAMSFSITVILFHHRYPTFSSV